MCECHQLTSYALLMEEDPLTTVVQLPDFHVEIIAASVAVGVILILIVLAMKVWFLDFGRNWLIFCGLY